MSRIFGIVLTAICFFGWLESSQAELDSSKILTPEVFTLENGLKVYALHSSKLPTIYLSLMFPVGSMHDPKGKEGLASLTADLLDKGTETFSRSDIQEQLDFLGASYGSGTSSETTSLSLFGLSKDLKVLVSLFADLVQNPAFPKVELNQTVKRLTGLIQNTPDDLSALASRGIDEDLFAGTPLAHPSMGYIKSIRLIGQKDLKGFHKAHFLPKGASLAVAGDFRQSNLKETIENAFKNWNSNQSGKEKVESTPDKPLKLSETQFGITLINKPGATQAQIRIARIAFERKDPRFYTAWIVNQVLGGGFTSRLNQFVRDDLGLTYSIRSQFEFNKNFGVYSLATFTKNETVYKTISETLKLLKQSAEKSELTEKEVSSSKSYISGVFPMQIQSIDSLADLYLRGAFHELPLNFVRDFIPEMMKVNLDEAKKFSKDFFGKENFKIVVVGDGAAVLPQLRKLGRVQVKSFQELL